MKYNLGSKYNSPGSIYNSGLFRVFVKVYDVFQVKEHQIATIAKVILSERIPVPDFIDFFVLHENSDYFAMNDNSDYFALFDVVDSLSFGDEFSDLLVLLELFDRQSVLDELRKANALIKSNEIVRLKEKLDWESLIDIADVAGLEEAKQLFSFLQSFETFAASDKTPRKAISDFVLGQASGKDSAYDWILPFDMKVDWKSTSMQVMPSAESTYIDIPGRDGSIVEDTVYKNRLFSIVAFSEQGLSLYEKEQLKRDIAQILDSTKDKPKKLTLQASGTCFDVKYSGSADITSGPSYVKATIPFETSPYGYPLFDREVTGTGLIINNGDCDAGCIHRISAGCVNPQFQLGKITYKFNGTVPQNKTLVIDHNNFTCYIESVEGDRTNALSDLSGEFQIIPKQSSVAITAYPNTEKFITTTIKEKVLW